MAAAAEARLLARDVCRHHRRHLAIACALCGGRRVSSARVANGDSEGRGAETRGHSLAGARARGRVRAPQRKATTRLTTAVASRIRQSCARSRAVSMALHSRSSSGAYVSEQANERADRRGRRSVRRVRANKQASAATRRTWVVHARVRVDNARRARARAHTPKTSCWLLVCMRARVSCNCHGAPTMRAMSPICVRLPSLRPTARSNCAFSSTCRLSRSHKISDALTG